MLAGVGGGGGAAVGHELLRNQPEKASRPSVTHQENIFNHDAQPCKEPALVLAWGWLGFLDTEYVCSRRRMCFTAQVVSALMAL